MQCSSVSVSIHYISHFFALQICIHKFVYIPSGRSIHIQWPLFRFFIFQFLFIYITFTFSLESSKRPNMCYIFLKAWDSRISNMTFPCVMNVVKVMKVMKVMAHGTWHVLPFNWSPGPQDPGPYPGQFVVSGSSRCHF